MEKLPVETESERAVLGAILLDNRVMGEAAESLFPYEFFLASNRVIFGAMLKLHSERQPIDLVTLTAELEALGKFSEVGRATYIASLIDGVPRTDTIEPYAFRIKRAARLRRMYVACSEIQSRIESDSADPEIIEDSKRLFFEACEVDEDMGWVDVGSEAFSYLEDLRAMRERGDHATGLMTGFPEFDMLTTGFQPGDLVILAGRPSQGKTSLAWNIAARLARQQKTVGFFSIEMRRRSIVEKSLAMETGINSQKIRTGMLKPEEWEQLESAAHRLLSLSHYVYDDGRLGAEMVRNKGQRLKRERGLDALFVDYLQLMAGDMRLQKRDRVDENTKALKAVAKELGIPVIAMCQLNREVERRGNHAEPQLSDLAECGAIEQHADVVLFVYAEAESETIANLKIGKQRCGPTGKVQLYYDKPAHRFSPLENRY